MTPHTILSHPGSAHKDDFLACSLMVAEHGAPIERRDPTPEDLQDPGICVIDVGGEHDPERMNFDHHQFPPEQAPACALSLVLKHLGLYKDARKFCPWLETAEWLDARGARRTAKWLKIDSFVVAQLSSPIDFSLLRYFAQQSKLTEGDMIWELMRDIGSDLLNYLRSLRENLTTLKTHVVFWKIGDLEIAFLPRVEDMAPGTAEALPMFVRECGRSIAGIVSPDNRGVGFGLRRFDDDLRLNFMQVEGESDVHFAHRQGFIAKTSSNQSARLQELLTLSLR